MKELRIIIEQLRKELEALKIELAETAKKRDSTISKDLHKVYSKVMDQIEIESKERQELLESKLKELEKPEIVELAVPKDSIMDDELIQVFINQLNKHGYSVSKTKNLETIVKETIHIDSVPIGKNTKTSPKVFTEKGKFFNSNGEPICVDIPSIIGNGKRTGMRTKQIIEICQKTYFNVLDQPIGTSTVGLKLKQLVDKGVLVKTFGHYIVNKLSK